MKVKATAYSHPIKNQLSVLWIEEQLPKKYFRRDKNLTKCYQGIKRMGKKVKGSTLQESRSFEI